MCKAKTYHSGKDCIHGHIDPKRYTVGNNCVECSKVRSRRPEILLRKKRHSKEYRKNPEVKARKKEYSQTLKAVAQAKEYRNRPEIRTKEQAQRREKRSGVTPALFECLWREQNGKCAVCKNALDAERVHADHCHDTKQPRGLLCSACNVSEGQIKKLGLSPSEWGKRMDAYLKSPPVKNVIKDLL